MLRDGSLLVIEHQREEGGNIAGVSEGHFLVSGVGYEEREVAYEAVEALVNVVAFVGLGLIDLLGSDGDKGKV